MKRHLSIILTLILTLSLFTSCTTKFAAIPAENNETEETLSSGSSVGETNEAPASEPTTAPVIEQADPANDSTLNILVIGNSFSTGWPDELNGLLSSAGIRANIFTVYYSGCTLTMHWNWLQNGQAHYRLRHHIQSGGISDYNPVNLDFCLKQRNWDIISIQHSYDAVLLSNFDADTFHERANSVAGKMCDYLKERLPKTKIVFFQEWAYNVGWSRNGKSIENQEKQTFMYNHITRHAHDVAQQNAIPVVPAGDAWQIARANPAIGDLTRDGYHDGPSQGGQYLNACLWYEFLTGESCVGNTYRPSALTVSEEVVTILQNAAHEAIENNPYPNS